jgi:hypothetical protein
MLGGTWPIACDEPLIAADLTPMVRAYAGLRFAQQDDGRRTVAISRVLPMYSAAESAEFLHYTGVPLCGMLVLDWTSKACHP